MNRRPSLARSVVLCLAAIVTAVGGCRTAPPEPEMALYVAASLQDVAHALATAWSRDSGARWSLQVGASSTLARQIERGAEADVYLPADPQWLAWLDERELLDETGAVPFATNALVVVVPRDTPGDDPLAAVADADRVALGDWAHVPAGQYARTALIAEGVWEAVEPHALPAADVRAALRLVEHGEADAAVVYATDAAASAAVRVVGPLALADGPVRYDAAVLRGADANAASFVAWLTTDQAQAILAQAGFGPPGGASER